MVSLDVDMPRAKRLKLLREAKERKEKTQNGAVAADASHTKGADSITHDQEPAQDKQDDVAEATQEEEDATTNKKETKKEEEDDEEDLVNLAPKRANWDIERDIAPMLKKLEKRTQRAIVDILREKMAAEQQEQGEEEEDEQHT